MNFYHNNTTRFFTLSVRDNSQWRILDNYERIESQDCYIPKLFELEKPKLPTYELMVPPLNTSTLLHQTRLLEKRPEEALRAPLRGEGSYFEEKTH